MLGTLGMVFVRLRQDSDLTDQSLLFIGELYPINTLAEFRFQQAGPETIIEHLLPVANITSLGPDFLRPIKRSPVGLVSHRAS